MLSWGAHATVVRPQALQRYGVAGSERKPTATSLNQAGREAWNSVGPQALADRIRRTAQDLLERNEARS